MIHVWLVLLTVACLVLAGRLASLKGQVRRERLTSDRALDQLRAAVAALSAGTAVAKASDPPETTAPARAQPAAVRGAASELTQAIPPPPHVAPAAPSPTSRPRVSLEEWLGVRGAAVGAGLIAAVAAVLFFRHAVRHDWLTPSLRLTLGVAFGAVAVTLGQLRRLRRFAISANALIGAGCVALYASAWSSHALYQLLPQVPATALMVAVTALCCALALRHGSQQIALLALLGGFATPLLLSSGADRPLELFGYLLLLDVAFLFLAQRRDWPVLAMLSLVATGCFQIGWVGLRMGADGLWIGAGVLAVFGLLYVGVAPRLRAKSESGAAALLDVTTAAALLLPFGFALYAAGVPALRTQPGPVLTLLAVLSAGACWLRARDTRMGALALTVALGSVVVLAVYLLTGDPSDLPLGAAALVGLAAIHHGAAERAPDSDTGAAWLAARAATLGGLTVVAVVSLLAGQVHAATALAAAALTALLWRQATRLPSAATALGMAGGLGLALTLAAGVTRFDGPSLAHVGSDAVTSAVQALTDTTAARLRGHLAGLWAVALALQAVPWLVRDAQARRGLTRGAGVLAWVGLVCTAAAAVAASTLAPDRHLPLDAAQLAVRTTLAWAVPLFAALLVGTAAQVRSGGWAAMATLTVALAQLVTVVALPSGALSARLVAVLLTAAGLTLWPLVVRRRVDAVPSAWVAAAWAAPLAFPAGQLLWRRIEPAAPGALALALAALGALAVVLTRRHWPTPGATVDGPGDAKAHPSRRPALRRFGAAALLLVTLAVPLQTEAAWWTLAWATEAWLLLLFWRRVDYTGLKVLAALLFAAVGLRLLLNPAVLDYYPRPGLRVWNWLTGLYLTPAVLAASGAALLRDVEPQRARRWETWLRPRRSGDRRPTLQLSTPLGALALGLAFAWLNLTVVDWFAVGPALRVAWTRLPARDLSFSLAWATFAVTLLALGMRRGVAALRYASLALLMCTIGKVFLFDLGHLQDLVRVASLVGLAVSLFGVSLAYQRFVFRRAS